MEFRVGQKYRIVDIDAWWDKLAYDSDGFRKETMYSCEEFKNGDILGIKKIPNYEIDEFYFVDDEGGESQSIYSLMTDKKWHDSCVELIEEYGGNI